MKNIMIVSALVLSIAGISTAQADDHWQGQNRGNNHSDRNDNRGGDRHDNRGGNRFDNRGNSHGWQGQRFHAPTRYVRPHGYQIRTWRNGDHLPTNYRTRQYYVDYRQYHLNAPPRGYQYIRVNNDVVLTAIATGVIASVLTGMYY